MNFKIQITKVEETKRFYVIKNAASVYEAELLAIKKAGGSGCALNIAAEAVYADGAAEAAMPNPFRVGETWRSAYAHALHCRLRARPGLALLQVWEALDGPYRGCFMAVVDNAICAIEPTLDALTDKLVSM